MRKHLNTLQDFDKELPFLPEMYVKYVRAYGKVPQITLVRIIY